MSDIYDRTKDVDAKTSTILQALNKKITGGPVEPPPEMPDPQSAPEKKNGEDGLPIPPYAVYNIGNSNPENLLDFVTILQEELIRAEVLPADYDFEAHKELVAMQPGDVPITYADTTPLERDFGFKPSTSLRTGLGKFAEWYKEYYQV